MKGSAFCIRPVTTSMSLLQSRWITIRISEWTYISNWVYSTHFSWPNCMTQIFKVGINISLNVFSSESQTRRWKTWDERGSSLSILCAFLYGLSTESFHRVCCCKQDWTPYCISTSSSWMTGRRCSVDPWLLKFWRSTNLPEFSPLWSICGFLKFWHQKSFKIGHVEWRNQCFGDPAVWEIPVSPLRFLYERKLNHITLSNWCVQTWHHHFIQWFTVSSLSPCYVQTYPPVN